jgi:hypothetical protein
MVAVSCSCLAASQESGILPALLATKPTACRLHEQMAKKPSRAFLFRHVHLTETDTGDNTAGIGGSPYV